MKAYFVSELVAGENVLKYLRKGTAKALSEKSISEIIHEVLVVLDDCHTKGFAHGGVQISNIVVVGEKPLRIMIKDFGFSDVFAEYEGRNRDALTAAMHLAPELVNGAKLDSKSDIWSMGILTYILISGENPYAVPTTGNATTVKSMIGKKDFRRIVKESFDFSYISPEGKDFLGSALVNDAAKRPSAAALLKHPWFEKAKTLDGEDSIAKNVLFTLLNKAVQLSC